MKKCIALAALLAAATSTAFAATPAVTDPMTLALDLGAVLAGGDKCGYTFNQSAVIAFIQQNVPADDLGFASMLNTMTIGSGLNIEELSGAAFIAQCAVVEQTARHYGFMN